MANPVTISCTKCAREYKIEEGTLGATVKCKGCGELFVAAVSKGAPGQPPASSNPPSPQEDDTTVGKAYTLVIESDAARCPNCAQELVGEKAVICVYCGFNNRTRILSRTRKLVDKTPGDYFFWHLPAILSSVVVLASIILLIVYFWKVPGWAASANPEETLPWLLNSLFFRVYMTIMILTIIWYLGLYAAKRFIYYPHPPEEEIFEK